MTSLVLHRDDLPSDRIMTANQIAEEIYCGTVHPKWVRRHVPHRIKQGGKALWYERDVRDFIDAAREAG